MKAFKQTIAFDSWAEFSMFKCRCPRQYRHYQGPGPKDVPGDSAVGVPVLKERYLNTSLECMVGIQTKGHRLNHGNRPETTQRNGYMGQSIPFIYGNICG